jgi:hypothetical protein
VTCTTNGLTVTSGATFPKGATTVSCTATDAVGNTSSPCNFSVTVTDNQAPTISCPADVTVNADPGECTASGVALGDPSSTNDNCGVASVVNDALASYPVGTNTVVWTATDVNGNSATCTQTVIVVDNQAPTISCPADVTAIADPDLHTASGVALGVPSSTNDNCGVSTVANDASEPYPLGTNNVVWTVTDIHGNSSSCIQRVIVAGFGIVSITRESNDIRVTWTTAGGKTNILQFATGAAGSFTTNFVNLSSPIIVPGTGQTVTNFLDVGGATNVPSRYYRVRVLVP